MTRALSSGKRWDGSLELPGKWVCPPDSMDHQTAVMAFKLEIDSDESFSLPIYVTADQRFRLFLNGSWIAEGPERGDLNHYYYHSVNLPLQRGKNNLVALVWWVSALDKPSYSQITLEPAFWMISEDSDWSTRVNTGCAPWESKLLEGFQYRDPEMCWGPGAKLRVDGRLLKAGFERGGGSGWNQVNIIDEAVMDMTANNYEKTRKLRPSQLPAMRREMVSMGVVKSIQKLTSDETRVIAIPAADPDWINKVSVLFCGSGDCVQFPANERCRIIIDLEDYICAYPSVTLCGGRDARIRLSWAESLFEKPEDDARFKSDRAAWEGLYFVGVGDEFISDGSERRTFTTLWWECGRWLELYIETGNEPLKIESLRFEKTGYPWEYDYELSCEDERKVKLADLARKTLENCQHETFMDCPYYEQLMYFPDTRLQILCSYVMSHDDRLVKKALEMFKASQEISGPMGGSRYPSRVLQTIPSLAPVIIEILYEYMMWRDNPQFVKRHLGTIRALIDAFLSEKNQEGLIQINRGWCFVDWVDSWEYGVPPGGEYGVSAIINWYFVMTLEKAACIEDVVGDSELASRNRRVATQIAREVRKTFWSEQKGLFADDLQHTSFSQHAQCFALLSGQLTIQEKESLGKRIMGDPSLHQCSLYYTHYLFEALRSLGNLQQIALLMEQWYAFENKGLKTLPEKADPSRSDCHAWTAHPLYHIFATFCGIRPASPFFKSVVIEPQEEYFGRINIKMPHPQGELELQWDQQGRANVKAPQGVEIFIKDSE